jgi:hypothetical protein
VNWLLRIATPDQLQVVDMLADVSAARPSRAAASTSMLNAHE